MPQDRESGTRARLWGYHMGEVVAAHLGATLLSPGSSNEAVWNGRQVLIKAAHLNVPEIGATIATVNRVDAIIAVLEDPDGLYTMYEISPVFFRDNMRQSRSPRASHVMMVKCKSVRESGILIGRFQEN